MAETMTREQRVVLSIAVLASFVSFLDGTVVNVALPAIAGELGGGLSTQQWVVDAYLVTLGAFILVAGSLSDVLGRIVVLRIGLIGFGVTSLAIAAAPPPSSSSSPAHCRASPAPSSSRALWPSSPPHSAGPPRPARSESGPVRRPSP